MDTRNNPHRRLRKNARTYYLIGYNAISCLLWFAVLGRVLLLVPLVGFRDVYGGVGEWTKWTQTLMLMEVLHSATGLVRSPLATTLLQILSRLLIVWPVLTLHPSATQPSPFYTSMLLAWSVTEVIRYSYFAISLNTNGAGVPDWLQWLRYNTFYVLYPVGITSECALIWKASVDDTKAGKGGRVGTGEREKWALWVVLGLYVPGSWVLYTHMIRQRRKVLRGKGKET